MRPAHFDVAPLRCHALLDSGGGEKLERYGNLVLARPEPQALWRRRLPDAEWKAADLTFERESDRGGRWRLGPTARSEARGKEPAWAVDVPPAKLWIRPTPFKHVGLFPEQSTNWRAVTRLASTFGGEGPPRLLNLFGYTGAASVLAALAGYEVTHVDASRLALDGCRQNAELSGFTGPGLRFVLEDALSFAQRELRRGAKYHVVLLDPPHYGRGPKGQKWQLEDHIAALVETAVGLTAERALVVLSTYAVGHSPLAFSNLFLNQGGDGLAAGELVLEEEPRQGLVRRTLSQGFCARWWRGLEARDVLP